MKKNNNFIIIMALIIVINILLGCGIKNSSTIFKVEVTAPVKVGVFINNFSDNYLSEVRTSLENIQKENSEKVQFTFFDGKGDQNIQNISIDLLLEKDVDLLMVNLVDTDSAQTVIDKIKEKNVPVILFNNEPKTTNAIKSYAQSIYIGTDGNQAGVLQGNILVNEWKTDRLSIDKNRDGIMQYIMLKGPKGNLEAIGRTKYSVLTIRNTGIQTEELASEFCDWNEELAQKTIEDLFLKYGNSIEVIIANNDSMAIGAVNALQKYGYNLGDSTKTIAVVGVDAIQEARDLINKGFMTGTVVQDAAAMAEALYITGMNLAVGKIATYGTDYKFDSTGVSIRIPYSEYIKP